MASWFRVQLGVKCRFHESRLVNGKPDRLFAVYFKAHGRLWEEELGWESEGWTEDKAVERREQLREKALRSGHTEAEGYERKESSTRMTFDDLMQRYLAWAREHKKHWTNDEYRYRVHLAEHLAQTPLLLIDHRIVGQVRDNLLDKDLAPATVTHCLAIIRQAFNKAASWGIWSGDNPTKKVDKPVVNNTKVRVLTPEEEVRLLTALREKSFTVYAMSVVSLYAGLRFDEIARLEWQHVHFAARRLQVLGRGSKFRSVPLCESLRRLFSRIKPLGSAPTDLIFPNAKGGVRRKLSATFPRVVKQLGLNRGDDTRQRVDFNCLRHTFVTRLASRGASLHMLKDLLGHADLQMVARYSKWQPARPELALKALEGLNTDMREFHRQVQPRAATL